MNAPADSAPAPRRRRRRLLRALLLVVALLLAALVWLLGTQSGLDFALARARALSGGA